MTFETLWEEVKKMGMLPDTAVMEVPALLSMATKKRLSWMEPRAVAEIISMAIEEINDGSVERSKS